MVTRRTESREWLSEQIADSLSEELEFSPAHINHLARQLLGRLSQKIGGAYVYIPSASSSRRMEIVAKFNGRNARELAEQHNVSLRTVYRLTSVKKS